MFCPNCGANVPENQAFCASCGAQMTPAANPYYQQQAAPAHAKLNITKDAMFGMRVTVVILALLSIFLIFFKGMGATYDGYFLEEDLSVNMTMEWNDWFEYACDGSPALPIVLQIISIVFILVAAVSVVLPIVMPQLSLNKFYNLIPAAVAAFCLLLFVIMLILAIAMAEMGEGVSVHPAFASWFYMASLGGIAFTSYKMFKGTK